MPLIVTGFVNQNLPVLDDSGTTLKGNVGQGRWKTEHLNGNEYLITTSLASCTGLALCDPVAHVASLAHFDGGQSKNHIINMLVEIMSAGGELDRIQASISGWPDFNQSAKVVFNSLEMGAWHVAQNRTTVFEGQDMLVVFGDGRVGTFEG